MNQFASFGSMCQNCHHQKRMKMNTIDTICPIAARESCPGDKGIGAAQPKPYPMRRLWALFLQWLEKRESRLVMRDLTDDQLCDIGLTRGEAATEVNKSFFWD